MNEEQKLINGAESFLAQSQSEQDKLHDNASSIIYLRTACKNMLKVIHALNDRVEELEKQVKWLVGK